MSPSFLFSQVNSFDLSKEKGVKQSSVVEGKGAENAIDNSLASFIRTSEEHNPWWEIDLGAFYMVEHIEIKVPNGVKLDNFYVFLSEDTISSSQSISEIVENQDISRLHVGRGGVREISINKSGRYLRIQKNGLSILEIGNIIIWGHLGELCGNGVDDDSDGKIDCDDSDCSAEIINVAVVQQPTCNICSDGVISVQEVALNSSRREISLDDGVTFSPMPNPYQQFSGLSPGDYNIIIRNKSFGCLTPWAGGTIELRAPLGQPLGHCENGDLESGNFTGWKGYTTLWVKEAGTFGSVPPYVGDFEEGFVDTRHRIVGDGVDNYAPSIHYPFSGSYCFLLGNKDNGYNIDKSTYSFVVDNDNKDFTFNYAPVLQDPSDVHDDFRPYFEYAFYYLDGGTQHLIPGSDFKVEADGDDPYWLTSKSWNGMAIGEGN